MGIAFVFPGQGAQYVGMGKDLAESYAVSREIFDEADAALGFSLSRLIFSGSDADLRLTFHAQPAILTVGVAALRAFETVVDITPDYVAGHSLGEYTALVAAGALSLPDAVQLVYKRGKLMDEAVPAGQGTMAAILGGDEDKLRELCRIVSEEVGRPVEIANFNCPGQWVVSGAVAAVEGLIPRVSEVGARRAVRLEVSGPFHSSLMEPAARGLALELERIAVNTPRCPVVPNVLAKPVSSAAEIREALARQVASPVLWERSVREMTGLGVRTYVEFGPGTVLSGLIRKTDKLLQTLHAEDPATLEESATSLSGRETLA